MVNSLSSTLVIRNAIPRDFLPVTKVLAAAFVESSVAGWLDPVEQRRQLTVLAYIGGLVRRTIGAGVARVAEDGNEIVGAALWSVHSGEGQSVAARLAGGGTDRALTEVHRRRRELDRLVDVRRPRDVACQQLVCVGVRPDRQGKGIGSRLLIGHHASLHVTGTPAYLVASAGRPQTWFERYGYSGIGPPQLLPGGPPVQAMWRPPGPADTC
jgi:GNAT superfamily N-acetyltransferase